MSELLVTRIENDLPSIINNIVLYNPQQFMECRIIYIKNIPYLSRPSTLINVGSIGMNPLLRKMNKLTVEDIITPTMDVHHIYSHVKKCKISSFEIIGIMNSPVDKKIISISIDYVKKAFIQHLKNYPMACGQYLIVPITIMNNTVTFYLYIKNLSSNGTRLNDETLTIKSTIDTIILTTDKQQNETIFRFNKTCS